MKIQTWPKEGKGQVAVLNNKTVSPLFTKKNNFAGEPEMPNNSYQRPNMAGNNHKSNNSTKIHPFNGKDDWKVWFNRFETIVNRQGWSDEDKLDHLLPKLQESAGDFAFTQPFQSNRNTKNICSHIQPKRPETKWNRRVCSGPQTPFWSGPQKKRWSDKKRRFSQKISWRTARWRCKVGSRVCKRT